MFDFDEMFLMRLSVLCYHAAAKTTSDMRKSRKHDQIVQSIKDQTDIFIDQEFNTKHYLELVKEIQRQREAKLSVEPSQIAQKRDMSDFRDRPLVELASSFEKAL